MLVTRVIGTKIRRRPKTSATSPSTRGWLTSERTATTRSRTLPTWSPRGSKMGRPDQACGVDAGRARAHGPKLASAPRVRLRWHDGRVRVVLHIGLPKTGTTYLQALLAGQRDVLRAGGVVHPFVRPGAMFEGAVEVRGSDAKFGLDPASVRGHLAGAVRPGPRLPRAGGRLDGRAEPRGARRCHARAGTTRAGAAGRPRGARRGHRARPGSAGGGALAGGGQAGARPRASRSSSATELRCDTGRDAGPDAGGRRPHFWHAQDFAAALERWTEPLPAGTRPPGAGARRPARPASCCGSGSRRPAASTRALARPAVEVGANPSLGAEQVALLREVNREVAAARRARGRGLDVAQRHQVVKRGVRRGRARRAARGGPRGHRPRCADVLGPPARRWLDEVLRRGHSLHGDPDDLSPVLAGPGDDGARRRRRRRGRPGRRGAGAGGLRRPVRRRWWRSSTALSRRCDVGYPRRRHPDSSTATERDTR